MSSPKQDRAAVRTVEDLQRKYDFSKFAGKDSAEVTELRKIVAQLSSKVDELENSSSYFKGEWTRSILPSTHPYAPDQFYWWKAELTPTGVKICGISTTRWEDNGNKADGLEYDFEQEKSWLEIAYPNS